uniref:Putative cell death regulator aven ovary overexpressed n=1 Tax=Rhipicephalus microplus TaxID=6941 RepID=A0A6M2CSU1_RHIMP
MAPKGKERRKENKRQRWKSLDAETKQPTQESEPADCGGDASKATEGKSSSAGTSARAPIEPTCDPQFRKRGLTSNWGRYDEPVEVETEYNRKRGEDFELLLSASAGASAHFRFKEQQDWQDEPAELNEFFSIDCDKIVDALLTIPVHERLGLPEDIFPAHIIQEFKDEAAACTERYEAFLRTGKRQDKKMPDVGESLTNTLQAAIIAAAKSKPKPKDEDDLEELLNLSLKSPQSDEPSRKDKKKDDDDRSLEFLLSLTEERAEKDLVSAAEEAFTTTVAEPEPKAMEEPVKPPPQPQKPTVDLEDWLDSVLQD